MLEQASVEEMFQKYGEMLYKICIVMLENTYDAEDTVQDVLIKYMTKKPLFETYEHEKAWLIRVTINLCKDKLRFYKQHPYINIETIKTTLLLATRELIRQLLLMCRKTKGIKKFIYI